MVGYCHEYVDAAMIRCRGKPDGDRSVKMSCGITGSAAIEDRLQKTCPPRLTSIRGGEERSYPRVSDAVPSGCLAHPVVVQPHRLGRSLA